MCDKAMWTHLNPPEVWETAVIFTHADHLPGRQAGKGPHARRKRISPHLFRHTAAVDLLEAGTEVNVIRGWLGHVSLDTTNRYAEITIRAKEAALRTCVVSRCFQGVPSKTCMAR